MNVKNPVCLKEINRPQSLNESQASENQIVVPQPQI